MKCDYCGVELLGGGNPIRSRTYCTECFYKIKESKEPQYIGIFCSACGEVSISSRPPDVTGVVVCVACGCEVGGDVDSDGVWDRNAGPPPEDEGGP